MKQWKLLFAVPVLAAAAMVPQGQNKSKEAASEETKIMRISELQYVLLDGQTKSVSALNVVEIRLLGDATQHIRLELYYENGDYSLIDAQAFHLLRRGPSPRDVKLALGGQASMRFPRGLH